MSFIQQTIAASNWPLIKQQLDSNGYALVKNILSESQCQDLAMDYQKESLYRKTIQMERYRFGKGEYKYFHYPLPPLVQVLRETVYSHLSTVANGWMNKLGIEMQYPANLKELQAQCAANGQTQPAVLILKYNEGGHNTLHQDLYGSIYFPMQVVLFLNEPGTDYTGGEFVLVQQTPRAQSKAIVLQPSAGDMLIFATNFRPAEGSRGYYRVTMKHGVSEVHAGERFTLGIIFHDAG